jgi:hypothetical protein
MSKRTRLFSLFSSMSSMVSLTVTLWRNQFPVQLWLWLMVEFPFTRRSVLALHAPPLAGFLVDSGKPSCHLHIEPNGGNRCLSGYHQFIMYSRGTTELADAMPIFTWLAVSLTVTLWRIQFLVRLWLRSDDLGILHQLHLYGQL